MAKKFFGAQLTILSIKAMAAFIAASLIVMAVVLSFRVPFLADHPTFLALLTGLSVGLLCAILPGEVRAQGAVRQIKFMTKGAIAAFLLGFVIATSVVFEAPRSTVVASMPSGGGGQSNVHDSVPAPEDLVQVSGFVRDVDERGVAEADVITDEGPRTRTDADGQFFLNVPKKWANPSNALEVSRQGFIPIHHKLDDRDLRSIYLHLGVRK